MLSQKFTITTIPYTPVGASLLARRMCATIKKQFRKFLPQQSPIGIEAREGFAPRKSVRVERKEVLGGGKEGESLDRLH